MSNKEKRWSISKKDPSFMDINPDRASLKKVMYWRVITFFISTLVAFFYLGELTSSIEMTIIEALILTFFHYIFEELWDSRIRNKVNND